jgi:DNA mismatch endonuclease (patch repair protein)
MNDDENVKETKTVQDRSALMAKIRSKDTKPELLVRRLIHSLGYRYRLHRKDLPGKPDLVFAKRRKVIFVHGCFWHSHNCKASPKRPKSNRDYWIPKLERNVQRDIEHQERLINMGWQILVLWECELKDKVHLVETIKLFLDS